MTEAKETDAGLGPDFPGKRGEALLRLLLPAGRREEFVGDLIEEAETVVLPHRGRAAALRWFWWQALTSASPMYARRCAREVGMNRQRWIVVILILIMGPIMALDSGVSSGSSGVIAMVVLAMAIPASAGLLSGNLRIHAAAGVASTVVLLIARLASGIEIRWYAMAWIFFALLWTNWIYEQYRMKSGDGNGPADSQPAT